MKFGKKDPRARPVSAESLPRYMWPGKVPSRLETQTEISKMTTATKVKIKYTEAGSSVNRSLCVWLCESGSVQIKFADGTTASANPLDSYAHTHGGAAYQAANEAWHKLFSR